MKGRNSTTIFEVGHTVTRRRHYQEVEIYINLYYQTRIKSHVTARCEAKELKSAPIVLFREVAKERLALEDHDIVDEVQKETVRRAEAAMAAVEVMEESERTPEQYQQ